MAVNRQIHVHSTTFSCARPRLAGLPNARVWVGEDILRSPSIATRAAVSNRLAGRGSQALGPVHFFPQRPLPQGGEALSNGS
jgi:hypothetical protein